MCHDALTFFGDLKHAHECVMVQRLSLEIGIMLTKIS